MWFLKWCIHYYILFQHPNTEQGNTPWLKLINCCKNPIVDSLWIIYGLKMIHWRHLAGAYTDFCTRKKGWILWVIYSQQRNPPWLAVTFMLGRGSQSRSCLLALGWQLLSPHDSMAFPWVSSKMCWVWGRIDAESHSSCDWVSYAQSLKQPGRVWIWDYKILVFQRRLLCPFSDSNFQQLKTCSSLWTCSSGTITHTGLWVVTWFWGAGELQAGAASPTCFIITDLSSRIQPTTAPHRAFPRAASCSPQESETELRRGFLKLEQHKSTLTARGASVWHQQRSQCWFRKVHRLGLPHLLKSKPYRM